MVKFLMFLPAIALFIGCNSAPREKGCADFSHRNAGFAQQGRGHEFNRPDFKPDPMHRQGQEMGRGRGPMMNQEGRPGMGRGFGAQMNKPERHQGRPEVRKEEKK